MTYIKLICSHSDAQRAPKFALLPLPELVEGVSQETQSTNKQQEVVLFNVLRLRRKVAGFKLRMT